MKEAKTKSKNATVIKVDKSLDNYLDKGLFKDKIAKGNHILKTVGPPKFSK